MSILAVGTVAFDSIETPRGNADRVLGGSATYICLAARFFAEQPRLVGVVGGDFPQKYQHLLAERGIDTAGLEVQEAGKTFYWAGRYHEDLNIRDTLTTELNVLETFDPVLPANYKDSRIICLGNLDPGIQRKVLDQASDPDFVVCDSMNFWIDHTLDSLLETLKRVDCLMINDEEARQLANHHNLIHAARAIQELGPRVLIIKKGEHGALLFNGDRVFAVPAVPLADIQDPTGAGDTFMGGFVGALASLGDFSDDSLRHAMVMGSAMASFVVERFGPERLVDLDADTIQERIERFRELTRIPEYASGINVLAD